MHEDNLKQNFAYNIINIFTIVSLCLIARVVQELMTMTAPSSLPVLAKTLLGLISSAVIPDQ